MMMCVMSLFQSQALMCVRVAKSVDSGKHSESDIDRGELDDGGDSESNGSESDVDRGELDDGGDSESNGSESDVVGVSWMMGEAVSQMALSLM